MASSHSKSQLAAWVSQALQRHQVGDQLAAESLYRQVLAQDAGHADALHLYGCLCDDMGRTEQAIALLMQALQCNPAAYPYHCNLANMLSRQGQWEQAIGHYQVAIDLKPDYAVAHNNMGLAYLKSADYARAETGFRNAIRYRSGYADPHYNLGLVLKARGDLDGAIAAYRSAINIRPGYAVANFNLGNALAAAQCPDAAVAAYSAAVRLTPEDAKIHSNLGNALLTLGRLDEAVSSFQEALRLDPQDVLTRSNLILAASYFSPDPAVMHAHCEGWDLSHGAALRDAMEPHTNRADPDRTLRIGYVSADFRQHAAAYWIDPLLTGHRHGDLQIFCYSNSDQSDGVTQRLMALADVWVNCAAMSDAEMAARIRQDEIDILVDLSGHTQGNRLTVFARQPAPVQVSWFGFPVSTGLKNMQFRFSNAILDPPGMNDRYYSEKLFRLPQFYAAFRPEQGAPVVDTGPAVRNGFVTFASFNNLAKITPVMFDLWAEILNAVPSSRMLLQAAGLDGADTSQVVKRNFADRQVDPERLILRGWSDMSEYLRLGQHADIVLDSYPFNGGVTTCHALWMGLPVVSLSGQSAASRVGRSILTTVGMADLVADDPVQYRDIALELARDSTRLQHLRSSMRDRMQESGLLDGQALAKEVESAYRTMWRNWCENRGNSKE